MHDSADPALVVNDGVVIHLAEPLVVTGRIELHGCIHGHVSCTQIDVGATGVIDGQLTADKADIKGTLGTQLTATSLVLRDGARISGSVEYAELTAELGAQIDATLSRKHPAVQPAPETLEVINE
jgi:Protein of unknown function, DUF583.